MQIRALIKNFNRPNSRQNPKLSRPLSRQQQQQQQQQPNKNRKNVGHHELRKNPGKTPEKPVRALISSRTICVREFPPFCVLCRKMEALLR